MDLITVKSTNYYKGFTMTLTEMLSLPSHKELHECYLEHPDELYKNGPRKIEVIRVGNCIYGVQEDEYCFDSYKTIMEAKAAFDKILEKVYQ